MAYTNVWTTAAPLDTQAANQGAVDFRATKLDVMQRIASFGAGLLAARPTPEATSASADWTGVMYWATDTQQVFRWNGASWDDISADIPNVNPPTVIFENLVPINVVDDGAAHVGVVIVLPANTLSIGSIVRMKGRAFIISGSATPFSTLSLRFDNTLVAQQRSDTLAPGATAVNKAIDFTGELVVKTATTEFGFGTSQSALFSAGGADFVYGIASNPMGDITTPLTISLNDDGGIASGNLITFEFLTVEVLNP